ncbi:MAG: hypothetical protein RL291_1547 [Pseudomonadota bacterium]
MLIENLKDQMVFRDTVVDRIWQTWSKSKGYPRSVAEAPVDRSLNPATGIPLCLVAHDGAHFKGTVALIDKDPDYPDHNGPWIDALWVEPEARGDGLAIDLIDHAARNAEALGHQTLSLEATDRLVPFYRRRGFKVAGRSKVERDLAVMRLDLVSRPRSSLQPAASSVRTSQPKGH